MVFFDFNLLLSDISLLLLDAISGLLNLQLKLFDGLRFLLFASTQLFSLIFEVLAFCFLLVLFGFRVDDVLVEARYLVILLLKAFLTRQMFFEKLAVTRLQIVQLLLLLFTAFLEICLLSIELLELDVFFKFVVLLCFTLQGGDIGPECGNLSLFLLRGLLQGLNFGLLFFNSVLQIFDLVDFGGGSSDALLDLLSCVPDFRDCDAAFVDVLLLKFVRGCQRFVDTLVFLLELLQIVHIHDAVDEFRKIALDVLVLVRVEGQLLNLLDLGVFVLHRLNVEARVLFAVTVISHFQRFKLLFKSVNGGVWSNSFALSQSHC